MVVDAAKSKLLEDIAPEELPAALGGSADLDWTACVDAWLAEEEEEEGQEGQGGAGAGAESRVVQ